MGCVGLILTEELIGGWQDVWLTPMDGRLGGGGVEWGGAAGVWLHVTHWKEAISISHSPTSQCGMLWGWAPETHGHTKRWFKHTPSLNLIARWCSKGKEEKEGRHLTWAGQWLHTAWLVLCEVSWPPDSCTLFHLDYKQWEKTKHRVSFFRTTHTHTHTHTRIYINIYS